MNTKVLTDAEHAELRDSGLLECHCRYPLPEHIALFDAWYCERCSRVLPRDTQLRGSAQ